MQLQKLNPELILNAYAQGLFPMADSANAREVYWYDPEMRGQLSVTHMHVPRRLRKTVRKNPYRIGFNYDFSAVIEGCARPAAGREETWINAPIRNVFESLHRAGYAHSAEAWHKNELVGGVYGLAIGGAFFGESMFSTATDASKICLVHLMAHLKQQGFTLMDTQFINHHLKQFGVYEVPRNEYLEKLETALALDVDFVPQSSRTEASSASSSGADEAFSPDVSVAFPSSLSAVEAFLQSITQTS